MNVLLFEEDEKCKENQRPFKGESEREDAIEQNTISMDRKTKNKLDNAKNRFDPLVHYNNVK